MAKKVSFWATKKVPENAKVNFRTKAGEKVSFTATKKVSKKVKVSFWAGKEGKKTRKR